MLTLERPVLDWYSLANGMGMEPARVTTLEYLEKYFLRSVAVQGPSLIEVIL
jgi:acetolactate synthase-1/2/3 large subunit